MKIICESKQEYDDLMEASEYLHDFDFGWDYDGSKFINHEKANGMVGFLLHLYREKWNEDKVPVDKLVVSIKETELNES